MRLKATAVVLGGVLIAACGDSPPSPPTRGMAITRVFEVPGARAMPHVELTKPATIDGEIRPAAQLVPWGLRIGTSTRVVDAEGRPALEVPLPDDLDGSRWVAVAIVGHGRSLDTRVAAIAPDAATVRLPYALDGPETSDFLALPLPELTELDITSGEVQIPAGAELSFHAAITQLLAGDVVALAFTITALENGRETVVHRAVLDPVHRIEDRGWVAQRADLSALAGRTVRFRFAARPADGGVGTSLPLWGNPVVLAPTSERPPPGVILVSLDTLRAASTGIGGARRPTTPCLDALAADGVTFENAITTAPHTLPAHTSLFTGLYIRHHGIRSPLAALAPEQTTLTERLHGAGYTTAAFTEDGFVVPAVGLGRGFDQYREDKSPDIHLPIGHAARTFRAGLDWLASLRGQPFFLFLHTYQVHAPYAPPPPYDTAFEPIERLRDANARDLLRYEQETRYLDDQLCAFLTGLAALGLRNRALLVITSDHGEEFGEHGQRQHAFQVYDETARVPLVLRLPGALPAGRHVPTAVSLVDVAPTVLDVLGLPGLPRPDGVSLLPLALGSLDSLPRAGVYTETLSHLLAPDIDVIGYRNATGSCIFVTSQNRVECYDRTIDPTETGTGRILSTDQRFAAAREAVSEFLRTPTTQTAPPGTAPAVDREREEKLRALGYIQ